MATNKTDYLKLNDWVGSDPFRREEINANFRTLDAKAKEHNDKFAGKADKGDVDALTTQLAQIPSQPINFSGRGTGVEKTIAQTFPSVTLASVQLLNPTATLSDTADWYVLQKLIYDGELNNYKRLNFPVGTFAISKPLDFTQKLNNCLIDGKGCIIKPSAGYTGELVLLNHGSNYARSRNLRLSGLQVDGLYKTSIGIHINDAHEWFLDNVIVRNCFIGTQLESTYYGEFSGEPVIQDCLTGIKIVNGGAGEVNTIDFSNIKINFDTDKRNFVPQNAGETNIDYDNRVTSKGVEIRCMVLGCKFDGLILEGMDYGYYGSYHDVNGNSIFNIYANYFEAIKKQAIYLVSINTSVNVNFIVGIESNRFAGTQNVTIGQGSFRILGNEHFNLTVKENGFFRTYVETDLPSSSITSPKTNYYINIKHNFIPTSGNAGKYNNYGDDNVLPSQLNMLPTIQDELMVEHRSRIRTGGDKTANPFIFSVNTKPLTFVGKYNMPVIQGDNGKYYMITTKDGSALSLTEVTNLYRLDVPIGSKTAKELYRMTGVTDGTSYFCVDIQNTVTYKSATGKWVINIGTANERTALGTGADFVASGPIPSNWYSPRVWNVQIDMGYNGQSGYWGYGNDWFGNNATNTQAIGTLAQRPANPALDGFIYYASDNSTYYQWSVSGSAWSTYTPLF